MSAVADPSGGGPGGSATPLFLDQTEARRAEKIFFWRPAPHLYLRVWMTTPPPPPHPLSEGLDPALIRELKQRRRRRQRERQKCNRLS